MLEKIKEELEIVLKTNSFWEDDEDKIRSIIEYMLSNEQLLKHKKREKLLSLALDGLVTLAKNGGMLDWTPSIIKKVIADERVLNHSLAEEIIYNACSTGQGFVHHLFDNEDVLASGKLDEIIEAVLHSNNLYEAYVIARKPIVLSKENALDFINLAGKLKHTDSREIRTTLFRNEVIAESEEIFDFFKAFYSEEKLLKKQVMRSAINKYTKEGKTSSEMIDVVKIISDYKSLAKLEIANYHIFRSKELLDSKFMISKIETFKHFKDAEGDTLFSCTELYDEESDPTIKREIDSISEEISNMPRDMKLLALRRARTMINFTKGERRNERSKN